MTSPRDNLSAQAKEAKARSMLERNKARGLIKIDNVEALVSSLSAKYGDKTYDIVLAAVTRPYDFVNKMGINEFEGKKITSAKLLQYMADNEISADILNRGLQNGGQTPPTQTNNRSSQPEFLDVQGSFQCNNFSYFKTENVPTPLVATPFGFSQTSVENWVNANLHVTPSRTALMNPGDNPLAATYLTQLGVRGAMNPPSAGNLDYMTYSLKELKNAAHLSDADITKILGSDAVAKADNDNVRVTRKAALYLLETNILRQYHEANPLINLNSRGR